MKIGIMTLHEADSYGAVLQAYALQQVLGKMGAQSEFLSFSTGERDEPGENAAAGLLVRRIRIAGERRSGHFERFRREHLICAPPCSREKAQELDAVYDRFIVGSDQVWNPEIPDVDGRYFLPFVRPDKRYSYAASFGADQLPEGLLGWCAARLAGFRGLSVREESGRELIRELTGRDALVCLDPTLLLTPGDWEVFLHEVEGPPYVLLFLLKNDGELVNAAKESARQRGVDLRIVTGAFFPQFGFEPWSETGVEQWLSLIRHAECVFTNSFHGVIFSLIFERPVYLKLLTGQLAGRNGRFVELLRKMGAEAVSGALCQAPVSGLAAKRIEEERRRSLGYLEGILADEA